MSKNKKKVKKEETKDKEVDKYVEFLNEDTLKEKEKIEQDVQEFLKDS